MNILTTDTARIGGRGYQGFTLEADPGVHLALVSNGERDMAQVEALDRPGLPAVFPTAEAAQETLAALVQLGAEHGTLFPGGALNGRILRYIQPPVKQTLANSAVPIIGGEWVGPEGWQPPTELRLPR